MYRQQQIEQQIGSSKRMCLKLKQWYETMFENYARKYEREVFVKGTKGEVDFIEQEIGGNRDLRILDIGCGTGRHPIELAGRGYSVTGIDLSAAQLARARLNAQAASVDVQFIQADARSLTFRTEFDLVTMICEGAFPLMETDEMNFAILKSASNALKKAVCSSSRPQTDCSLCFIL